MTKVMRRRRLDQQTAEDLLTGHLDRADVPTGLEAVAVTVQAARRPFPAGDPARHTETLAAMAAAVQDGASVQPPTPPRSPLSVRSKLAVGAAAGSLALFGSLTTASALSGSVASTVHDVAGVKLPLTASTHRHSTTSSNNQNGAHPNAQNTVTPVDCAAAKNHGEYVSSIARSTTATGADKGAAVSAAAQSDCPPGFAGAGPESSTHAPTTPAHGEHALGHLEAVRP